MLPQVLSPTQRQQLAKLRERMPKSRLFVDDMTMPANAIAAAEMVGGEGARVYHTLGQTRVVASFDADFLGGETEPDDAA